MENLKLGNLEELVLLIVSLLHDKAYSVSIVEEFEKQTGRTINLSAIHTVLYRLEEKGFLESRYGESTSTRGGKRKRLFCTTAYGKRALDDLQAIRDKIRLQISDLSIKWN